ncbi:MAG: hypothetical protein ACOCWW_04525, partial [Bacteroidota bacterium]
ILQSLKNSPFYEEGQFNLLKDIFYISDLVKFAKFKPLADEHKKCYDDAVKFVDETKLVIEEKENGEDDKRESLNKDNELKPHKGKIEKE